jgi:hypothetical protein
MEAYNAWVLDLSFPSSFGVVGYIFFTFTALLLLLEASLLWPCLLQYPQFPLNFLAYFMNPVFNDGSLLWFLPTSPTCLVPPTSNH